MARGQNCNQMSPIPFIKTFDFEYGKAARLSPLCARIIADNPGPFTFTGTGVYIIGSGENVAVIDPGPVSDSHAAALDKALEGKRVSHVLLTHHHSDHSPLAAPLAAKHGCKVYGHRLDKIGGADGAVQMDAGADVNFNPDVDIRDGYIICGDGFTLRAIHTPGHTSNHICFALIEENALFSGDHIMGWATTIISPPDGNMGDYFASLDKVKAQNFDKLYPTHGAPIENPDSFVQAYIDHRRLREAQILEQISAGKSAIIDMVIALYQHVDKRLYPAAAQSVFAHILHLVESSHVTCDSAKPSLKSAYTLP